MPATLSLLKEVLTPMFELLCCYLCGYVCTHAKNAGISHCNDVASQIHAHSCNARKESRATRFV